VRTLATALFTLVMLTLIGCGGGSSSTAPSGPLTGNWQFNLTEEYPSATTLSVSGFVVDSNNTLTGSVQGPTIISSNLAHLCGGVGPITGSVSGQNVTFSVNPGGAVFNFAGTLASDNTISGTYQSLGGACLTKPTTGTFTASLIPTLTGNFTGTLTDSTYMAGLTGVSPAAPISVTGTITQSSNAGDSSASLSGTITAVGYPCFQTVSLTGSISGQSVYMKVYGYNGVQIGTIGEVSTATGLSFPAQVSTTSGSTSLQGNNDDRSGLNLDIAGVNPCPAITAGNVTTDNTGIDFTLQ
jgi:hypothetical protein